MTEIRIDWNGSEIVTTQAFKDFCRIQFSYDDDLINAIITQSRIFCENYISKDIVPKERVYFLSDADQKIVLPFGPVDRIQQIKDQDDNDVNYKIIGINNEQIEFDKPLKNIKISYVTKGINNNLTRQSILQFGSTLYENRADFDQDSKSVSEIPTNVKTLLTSLKTMFI